MSLKPEYFCAHCEETQPKDISTLKTCTICTAVKYCSNECQKSHYPEHKKDCLEAKNFIDSIENGVLLQFWPKLLGLNQKQYFACERFVEIFNTDFLTNDKKFVMISWPILTQSYLYLGQDDKLMEGVEKLKEFDTEKNWKIQISNYEIALKLNKIAKIRKNPPKNATEEFENFRKLLLESSQETHLQLASSSPVMAAIQKYIYLSYVEQLQGECALFIANEFDDKKGAYIAFQAIINNTEENEGLVNMVVSQESETCKAIFYSMNYYFRRHPEFQDVIQKYEKVYWRLKKENETV